MRRGGLVVGWCLLAGAPACGRIGYDRVQGVGDDAGVGIVTDGATIDGEVIADVAPDRPVEAPPDVAVDQRSIDLPPDTGPVVPAACPEAGGRVDPNTGHCYFMPSMSAMLWDDARVACGAAGAHLATLTSPGEQAFAVSVLATEELWIGLYRVGTGPYQWVTGEPVTFTAWAPLEPDEATEGRARLAADGWHDTDVRRRYLTLCERDP